MSWEKENSLTPIPLTPGQASALRASLYLLEQDLEEMERLLLQPERKGLLYTRHNDLSDSLRKELLGQVAHMKQQISSLVNTLGLQPEDQSCRRHLLSILSVRWSDLEDTRPHRLRGYGALSPELSDLLEEKITGLIQILCRMMGQLNSPPSR